MAQVQTFAIWSNEAISKSIDVEELEHAETTEKGKPLTALQCVSIVSRNRDHYLVNSSSERVVHSTVKTVEHHSGKFSTSTRVFRTAPGEEVHLGSSGGGSYDSYSYERTIVGAYFEKTD